MAIFDKRGTGISDRVAELPGVDQRMDDLRAVLDAASMEQAALIGLSEGVPLTALFAATYPDRCRALVLYGGFARFTSGFRMRRRWRSSSATSSKPGAAAAVCESSRPRDRMILPSKAGGAKASGLARARLPLQP